jgi:hypothetical protein
LTGNVYKIFDETKKGGQKHLLEPEAKRICMENRTPVTRFEMTNAEETVRLADEISYPSFLKIVSPDVIRRLLGLSNPEPQEPRECWRNFQENPAEGREVQAESKNRRCSHFARVLDSANS